MGLIPKTPREWIHMAVFGVVIFVLGLATNVPAAQWLGTGLVVAGLAGSWVTAMIAERATRR